MKRQRMRRGAALLCIAAAAAVASAARADDFGRAAPRNPAYDDECGGCHTAYPPGLLPAASWQRVMGGLSRHYGTDASIDAARASELLAWLRAHAATGRRAAPPPQDRITRSAWFLREHREVATDVWHRASVRQPSNCAACHTRADAGSFREREIGIPQ